MKILVFENGEAGRLTDIPGENVQGEIEELLGGEIQTQRMAGDLFLASRALPEHEKEEQPKWYAAKRSGDPYEHYVSVQRLHGISGGQAKGLPPLPAQRREGTHLRPGLWW